MKIWKKIAVIAFLAAGGAFIFELLRERRNDLQEPEL